MSMPAAGGKLPTKNTAARSRARLLVPKRSSASKNAACHADLWPMHDVPSSPPPALGVVPWRDRLRGQYRWVIVLVASLAMSGTLPGRTHGLGLITKPLLMDLKLSELDFGAINFWSIVLGAAFCWPVGRLIDRFGTRGVLTAVVAVLGIVVVLTGYVRGPWQLFVALLLTRGLGQGALSVISTAMIGKWFNRQVGMAMGVFAVLLAIGFIAGVVGVGTAAQQLGWRPA